MPCLIFQLKTKNMKTSFYNLYAKCPQGILCFNTYQDNFLIMHEEAYNDLHCGNYEHISSTLLESLVKNKLVIDNNENEYEQLIQEYKGRDSNGNYSLILITSLDCNVRCWYCFEKHIKGSRLSIERQNHVFRYAQHILDKEEFNSLHITLFGGEPLLYFAEEVYPLMSRIKEYADNIGKVFTVSAITNATCITEEIMPLLTELKVSFQISIDGYREKHNSIKKIQDAKDSDAYGLVIRAIHLLTTAYGAHINLRLNYDNQTFKHLDELFQDLSDIKHDHITVHLERVWQTKAANSQTTGVMNALNEFTRHGFCASYMNFYRRNYSCYSDLRNGAVISYNGEVYKCTGRDFIPILQEGILTSDGTINWNIPKAEERLNIKTYNLPMCKSCKLLPQCWGPCTQKHLEDPANIENRCPLRSMEITLEDYIRHRFNNEYLVQVYHQNTELPFDILR